MNSCARAITTVLGESIENLTPGCSIGFLGLLSGLVVLGWIFYDKMMDNQRVLLWMLIAIVSAVFLFIGVVKYLSGAGWGIAGIYIALSIVLPVGYGLWQHREDVRLVERKAKFEFSFSRFFLPDSFWEARDVESK